MRQFRVVLRGPQGHSPECDPSVPAGPSLRADLAGLGSCAPWFRPEAVRVRLARSPKAYAPPGDWELPLVPRAAAVTLAAAGVLGALSGAAEASPRWVAAPPPSLASSSARTFMPTDRSPEVVLLEARQVRLQDSFRYTPGPALTDARGNPILIAAYHSNTTSPHSNSAGTPHGNVAGTPHGNTAGTPHGNTAGTPHGNTTGTPHGNTAGTAHGNVVGTPHGNTAGTPHGNTAGTPHGNTVGTPHGNTAGTPHGNTDGVPHGNTDGVPHGNLPWTNHSNTPGGHANGAWQNHANAASGGVHTNMIQGDYVF